MVKCPATGEPARITIAYHFVRCDAESFLTKGFRKRIRRERLLRGDELAVDDDTIQGRKPPTPARP